MDALRHRPSSSSSFTSANTCRATSSVAGAGDSPTAAPRILSTAAYCSGVAFTKRNSRSVGIAARIRFPGPPSDSDDAAWHLPSDLWFVPLFPFYQNPGLPDMAGCASPRICFEKIQEPVARKLLTGKITKLSTTCPDVPNPLPLLRICYNSKIADFPFCHPNFGFRPRFPAAAPKISHFLIRTVPTSKNYSPRRIFYPLGLPLSDPSPISDR